MNRFVKHWQGMLLSPASQISLQTSHQNDRRRM
jgi:hypothetical protein